MEAPSRVIALYGTDEVVPPPHMLRAGPLSAELEAGNLRHVRWHGEEVLRAVSFILRDRDWGTYAPDIADLEVVEEDDAFRVTFGAVAGDDVQSFTYGAVIEGRADGVLTFHGGGTTETGFETNRTGFVVLYPIDGIAGSPVTIRHTDGREVQGTFPEIIDPVQPMLDLRALTHVTPGGARVETVMEGDTYEMEDQRNWTDASYKVYVRPLAMPWPYHIAPGEVVDQTVTVTVTGRGGSVDAVASVALSLGAVLGALPPVGVGLRPEDLAGSRTVIEELQALAPAYLVLHHNPRAGHSRQTLAGMLEMARALDADPWLEAVIAATDDAGAAAEIAALGATAASLGAPFGTVLVSPAPDLKCTLPGSVWPIAPEAAALYDAARAAFPKARIGGGMFSYFTELNRKRPPTEHLDLVSFTTSPLVHAGDDRSLMQSRATHPAIAASATGIADGTPWAVGPSAIGIRDNPYGASAKDNPRNVRQAMNRNDPRQRGLLGAVWALGYFADFAAGGASAIALGGTTGPFGAVATTMDDPQRWFEEAGGVYPVFHVLRGLARLRGAALRDLGVSASGPVCGLAAETPTGTEIWIAVTGPDPVTVSAPASGRVAILDAERFAAAAATVEYMDELAALDGDLHLDSYAVARILIRKG